MSEPTSADDYSINRFPTAISESASTFTATLTAVRQHSTGLLEGLAKLSRIDRGDGARWRELLQKAQQILTTGPSAPPLDAHPEFGVLLRQHREQAGMTQQELAERAGVSTTWLRGIEAGRSRVTRRMMLKLMNIRELALSAEHLNPAPTSRAGQLSEPLNADCSVPGSYSLDAQLKVVESTGQERKFVVWRVKRYEPEQLTEWLAQRGWQRIYFSQFGHHGRNQMGLMLLQKRS